MIEVKKNNNESLASLLRRFKLKIRQADVLSRAKSLRYKSRSLSKYKKKQMALEKMKNRKEKERLRRLGKAR